MWFALTDKKTGDRQVVASLDGIETKGLRVVELEREPGEFDDVVEGKLRHNPKREADALAGRPHIAEAHTQKRIEAALIVSGIELKAGLLFEEAAAEKLELLALAESVLRAASEFTAREMGRRAAARKDSSNG